MEINSRNAPDIRNECWRNGQIQYKKLSCSACTPQITLGFVFCSVFCSFYHNPVFCSFSIILSSVPFITTHNRFCSLDQALSVISNGGPHFYCCKSDHLRHASWSHLLAYFTLPSSHLRGVSYGATLLFKASGFGLHL